MDRTISPALQRPMSIPDSSINTIYPKCDKQSSNAEGFPGDYTVSRDAIQLFQYNRIQSEVVEVHFQGKSIAQSWPDWVKSMEQAVDRLYHNEAQPDSQPDFARQYCLLRLHRPSPRVPMPSSESLVAAFEAACRLAVFHREHIGSGVLRRTWLTSHQTAETAMTAVFALRHAYNSIVAAHAPAEIFDMMKSFTANLLAISAQGWTEISNFAATFENLLAPLLTAVFRKVPAASLIYPTELDSELNNFLLPQTTTLDSLFAGASATRMPDFDFDMDMDNLMTDDWFLEAFDGGDQFSWEGMDLDQVALPIAQLVGT
jgi:hypothetical protein